MGETFCQVFFFFFSSLVHFYLCPLRVDLTVGNLVIRAARPVEEYQNMPMPTNDVGRVIWFESAGLPPDRLNKRQFGYLKGKALQKAKRLVNKNGGIGMSGEVGSIMIDEKDFIPTTG